MCLTVVAWRLAEDPLSVSRQHNSSSPVLQQQQAAPPDELPPAKPMTESGGNAASEPAAVANPAPPNNPPPMSCKPPKKRYLENLENGTYGGGAAGRLKSESSSSPSPTPSPVPCAPLQRAASTDQQTNNACSALLELAEVRVGAVCNRANTFALLCEPGRHRGRHGRKKRRL